MIIGHYHPYIWSKGGISSYIRRISARQESLGHDVYFFSIDGWQETKGQRSTSLVKSEHELFERALALKIDILHIHAEVGIVPPDNLTVIRTLHGHQPYCPSGSKYLKRSGLPCNRAYSIHGCLWGHLVDHCGSVRPQKLSENFQLTWQEKKALNHIPVIAVSQFLKDQMVSNGYSKDNIHVLKLFAPSMHEKPLTLPQSNPPKFVFLGRISPEKGLEWLVRSLQHVKTKCHLDIAGEGYQEDEIKQIVKTLDLQHEVAFHGWLEPKKISSLISNARAVIFPSLWHEPGGTVAFEAMAHARAVIMSRVGGMPEVVKHRVNGLLVEPGNLTELGQSIESLALDWKLAKELGDHGRSMALHDFTLQHHMDELHQLYAHAIASKQASSLPA